MTEQDTLLAELNGLSNTSLTQADPELAQAIAAAAPKGDPLDVTPGKDAASAAAKADAKSSKAVGGDGYLVTIRGTYTVRPADGKGRATKEYRIPFRMPYLIHPKTGASALGIIVGKLLNPAIKKTDVGSLGYRTHEVESAEPLTPSTPPVNHLQFMDRTRLIRYIADNAVPINAAEYHDVSELRDRVIDWKLNPKDFEAREAKRAGDRADVAELLAMNPELGEVDVPVPNTVAGI